MSQQVLDVVCEESSAIHAREQRLVWQVEPQEPEQASKERSATKKTKKTTKAKRGKPSHTSTRSRVEKRPMRKPSRGGRRTKSGL